MLPDTTLVILLIVYLAPLVFVIWAILSVVAALKRIATALEAQALGERVGRDAQRLDVT